jgi:hypothetical protein
MLRLLGITGLQAMPALAINSTLHIETLCLEHNSTRPIALMSIIGSSALDFAVGRKVAAYPCVCLFRRLSSREPERYKLQPRPIQFSLDRKEAAHRQRFYSTTLISGTMVAVWAPFDAVFDTSCTLPALFENVISVS